LANWLIYTPVGCFGLEHWYLVGGNHYWRRRGGPEKDWRTFLGCGGKTRGIKLGLGLFVPQARKKGGANCQRRNFLA